MITRKLLWLSLFPVLLTCIIPCAFAQNNFEVTPFFGARFGGQIDINSTNVDYLKIRNTYNYGVMGNVGIWGDNFEPEFMWNRQPTFLSAHSTFNGSLSPVEATNLDMYQFSALYQFGPHEKKLRPFVVAGIGFTHFSDPDAVLGFGNKLSWNIGGGAKYFFAPHVGLRLEARWSPSRTTQSTTTVCNPFFGICGPALVNNKAEQGQVNLGIVFRFQRGSRGISGP
jgi:opacity protein-like surface antigen